MKNNLKKVLAVLLTLCMLTGMMIIPTGAVESENTALTPDTSWFRGNAVEDDTSEPQTYELSTAAQLLGFAEIAQTYDFAGDTIKLMADIDLNAGWDATTTVETDGTLILANAPANVWTVIPTFKGTLDGNGHTISGIYSTSDFTVPTSSQRYVGGFINELVNGTVKNLIVKNSLTTFSSSTGDHGTSKICIGGFISRVVDSNLENIYADIDAWLNFAYHYTMGGLFCSIEADAEDNVYIGTIKNIVSAGCIGRTVDGTTWNKAGTYSGNIYMANLIGMTSDSGVSVDIENISFIGWSNGKTIRTGWGGTSKCIYTTDLVSVRDSNAAIDVKGYSIYSNELGSDWNWASDLTSGTMDLSAAAWCHDDDTSLNSDEKAKTYAERGFSYYEFVAGDGTTTLTGMLPGAVVDMLNASSFEQDTTSENMTIGADTGWYGSVIVPDEPQPETYYLYTPEQLLGFAEIAQTYDFAGDTVKLMADIDLNAGWDATTTVETDGTLILANAPANVWTVIPTFKGTLDGNGHTISGIYSTSDFTVPTSSQRYVGGFINELVNGTVKNLIVKNSLTTFSSSTGDHGTSKICIGGFISRVVDSNLENIYADIDAWLNFAYHYTMGGLFCSIEADAEDNVYIGTIKNIVSAGCIGRTVDGTTWNKAGTYSGNIYMANLIGMTSDSGVSVDIENISFIGWSNGKTIRTGWGGTSKCIYTTDLVSVRDSNAAIDVKGYSIYSNELGSDWNWASDLTSGTMDLSAAAWCHDDDTSLNSDEKAKTYAERGFSYYEFVAGDGTTTLTGMLPGAVVDMLTANTSNLYLQESLDGTKIRFIGVVNISEEEFDNFSALGFDIAMTYNGKTYTNTYTTTTVYTSLMANGTPVSASEYGGTYFYAVEITGLDAATAGNVVFNVDGITIHAGETTTNVFGSGEYTYSAN